MLMSMDAERAAATIAGECLAVRVRMLNRIVTGMYDDALRPIGVKVSQLNILVAVARAEPVSPSRISQILQIEKSTLSRNLRRMRVRGWLDTSGEVTLTKRGRRLIEDALPLWRSAQRRVRRRLGGEVCDVVNRGISPGRRPA